MPEIIIDAGSPDLETTELLRYTGEEFNIVFTFRDRSDGSAIDISEATLSLALGTAILKDDGNFDKTYGESNQAEVTITASETANEGYYRGQVTAVLDTRTIKSNPITLLLLSGGAELTIDDLRMALWDFSTENTLLDAEEFSDALLMQARKQAIDDWNGQPGYHDTYTVSNFPVAYLGMWRKGAIAHALLIRAFTYARNRLNSSVAGITVQDKDKAPDYVALAQPLKQEWIDFIRKEQYYKRIQFSSRRLVQF